MYGESPPRGLWDSSDMGTVSMGEAGLVILTSDIWGRRKMLPAAPCSCFMSAVCFLLLFLQVHYCTKIDAASGCPAHTSTIFLLSNKHGHSSGQWTEFILISPPSAEFSRVWIPA